ncbi:ATP synthase subunit b 2 [Rickettsiales bacterium Ac37b]|nr:ATP synthase subunit b 2 [Rickettsiales bacterium Ac37b]
MPQLDPSSYLSQIFWLVVTFILLYGLLHYITVPMMQKLLQKRQDVIADNLKKAEELKKKAELIEEQYNISIKEAHLHSANLIQEANNKINNEMVLRLQELDSVIKEYSHVAEERMVILKQELAKNLAIQAESLTSLLIEKMVGSKPDVQELRQIISNMKGHS